MTVAAHPFVHLDVASAFSLRTGASSPEALVARAAELGFPALALTDANGPYGAVRFVRAAREAGIDAIIGATVTAEPGGRLVLLVRDAVGWRNLCRLLTTANLAGEKEKPQLDFGTLAANATGLTALVGPGSDVAGRLLAGDREGAGRALDALRALFPATAAGRAGPPALWLELVDHLTSADRLRNRALATLGSETGVGAVATNMVAYATPEDGPLHDTLAAIRHRTTVQQADRHLALNHEAFLKPAAEMADLFAWQPQALVNAGRVAAACAFRLETVAERLPEFPLPPGETAYSYLLKLAARGAEERYRPMTPRVSRQVTHELTVIDQLGWSSFFLVIWDIVRFARERGILVQGRGSAANSVVAYALGITAVDPLAHDLLFERFLSAERIEAPDVDLDVEHERREEVIQYLYGRYGRDRAAMVCEVICYRARSVARDVRRALGLVSEPAASPAAGGADASDEGEPPLSARDDPHAQVARLCRRLDGQPRHLGIHSGGMLLTARPLIETLPVERARMDDRTVAIWDKDDLADLGLVKVDILGLGMLTLIGRCLRMIQETRGADLDLAHLTRNADDPAVYAMITAADTVGVFQVESRSQTQFLPRLRPRTFKDLAAQVSIIRPGPIQGGSVHPYIRRRRGEEPVVYPHPLAEPILRETLGVPLWQEQGMRLAMAIGGFSAGEADRMRRAMGKYRSVKAMAELEARFHAGAAERGVGRAAAETIWTQLAAFSAYGFPASHACSFALLTYQSAWLRHYYPVEFRAALLASQPMGFYSPRVIVGDAQRHGITVLGPDILVSDDNWTAERLTDGRLALRVGLRAMRGLGPEHRAALATARGDGPFQDLADLRRRAGLPREVLATLAACGALTGFEPDRRQALWAVETPVEAAGALPGVVTAEPAPDLAPMTRAEMVLADYAALGFSPEAHLLELHRAELARCGIITLAELAGAADGARVRVAGLVEVAQRPPTAKGIVFLGLDDETALANVVVFPDLAARRGALLGDCRALVIDGVVQRVDEVVSLRATRLEPLDMPAARPPRTLFR